MTTFSETILSALKGERGPDQRRIATIGLAWVETILLKNLNYGSSVWKAPALQPEMPVSSAILVRMSDKVSRIAALTSGIKDAVDEPLEDTVKDLGAYCLLYLARPLDGEDDGYERV